MLATLVQLPPLVRQHFFWTSGAGARGAGALTHEMPVSLPNSATLMWIASVLCLHHSHEGSIMRADFASQAYFRNPVAEIEKLRSAGPVVEVQFPMVGKVWTTTTQDLADRVLKDSETFTIRTGTGAVTGLQWWMPRILRTLANHMLAMDEPDHRRLRDIVDEAFRRRAVMEMEPRILAIADDLAGDLFAEGSPTDLVDRYARTLPLSVICELLGLPLEDRPKFTAWASGFTRLTGTIGLLSLVPNILAMRRYLKGN